MCYAIGIISFPIENFCCFDGVKDFINLQSKQKNTFYLHTVGSRKLQIITVMITNALIKEKNVLFVAEKMLALVVVQKRLQALGVQKFCLKLHSNKSTFLISSAG